MKTVVVLASLVALCLAGTVPPHYEHVETKTVDADFILRQKKVLSFFNNVDQMNPEAEYFKIGKDYDIEANIEKYTNKKAVEEFLVLYRTGFMPKNEVFSIFYERMREEAIALFHLFYYAQDFETFYKTAAFARYYFNEYQFIYAYYIAILHREDTTGIVVPAPYEVYPEYFTNTDTLYKAYRLKMQDGINQPEFASQYGIIKEGESYVFYSNYSNYITYDSEDQRLSYFTEDIGLNSYYYYFHSSWPFWMSSEKFGILKERRGEIYFYFYQQLLARYYMERLVNGLGEIPEFSWFNPIKTGYTPYMSTLKYPFSQRSEYYFLDTGKNTEDIQFLDTYEKTFLQYLQRGQFKAYNQEVDFHNSKSVNFVGNFWQSNADLYQKHGHKHYQHSYEIVARQLLSAIPKPFDKYTVAPSALSFYQTSLRDPMFYQLYSKIMNYFLRYKQYLVPYTQDKLHYVGVKVTDVQVEKLVTFFDFFDYDVTNALYKNLEELKTFTPRYVVRQPRLDHKPFSVTIDVKSDVETEAIVKVFMGPKYDSNGYPISLEDNWMNFVELDWFKQKLTPGQNKIVRKSDQFFFYKQDSVPITQLYKFLEQGKVPVDMSQDVDSMPKRLMLPKGTDGGFPFQFFVFVYPYQAPTKEYEQFDFLLDSKPFGYPFDRPAYETYFKQPNMFFKDVFIYFQGEHFPYSLNNPFYAPHKNVVPKH